MIIITFQDHQEAPPQDLQQAHSPNKAYPDPRHRVHPAGWPSRRQARRACWSAAQRTAACHWTFCCKFILST